MTQPDTKTQTIRAWEDDPGQPPATRQPIQRPVPDGSSAALAVGVAGVRPAQSGDFAGSEEFRYWAAADALSRAATFWDKHLPTGTVWNPDVGPVLEAVLDSGDLLNAFYDREGLKFFRHSVSGVTVHSGESPDVVCHETGHAVLDALRPELWGAFSAEIAAFHESFGDMSAILSSLDVGSLADDVLAETHGNPAQSSRLSRLAEQLGWAIRQTDPAKVESDCLRNAANSWFYQDPVALPPLAPASQLSSEPHYFSRVFTGAFFEGLAGIFRQQQNRDGAGLVAAGDIMGRLLVTALRTAPVVPGFFAQTAAHMLAADQALYGGAHAPALSAAFIRHGILSPGETISLATLADEHLAAVTEPEPGPLPSLAETTVPGERFGLTGAFSVRVPGQEPRFRVAGAAPEAGELRQVATPERAALSFVEDLFRQGRVKVPDEVLTPAAPVADGTRTHTHAVTRTESGGLILDRVLFAAPCDGTPPR
ncbi:hypothetical protein [Streptomyces fuscichromogenes]|uniref:Uncharacterized protein n=1 Tax=Streptomyces fuscichromogenes TaxID=1324013 RepID=A0A918CU94_9ACTN|nr:hypothetical protein [Streptomyces fuscichromogenes]GGN26445.1 hypothetical protein GCM10011578_061050 [Streptomyces fuscichromogenes]